MQTKERSTQQNGSQPKCVLEGSVEDVSSWVEILSHEFNTRRSPESEHDSAMEVVVYHIAIMGRDEGHPDEVKLRVELDRRIGKGRIKVSSGGMQRLLWQVKARTLCVVCKWGHPMGSDKMFCSQWRNPSRDKRWCMSYKWAGNTR